MGAFDSVTKKISSLVGITTPGQALAANSLPVVLPDAQIPPPLDNGTSRQNAVRLLRGDLVKVALRGGGYSTDLVGAGTTATWSSAGNAINADGVGAAVSLVTAPGLSSGARIWYVFYGRSFGIRWRRDSAAPSFTVGVDGEYVGVVGSHPYLTAEGIGWNDGEALQITHDNLNHDGPHYAEIILTSDPSASKTLLLYGWLLERRAGYQEAEHLLHHIATVTLTTAQVAIMAASDTTSAAAMRGVRQIIFSNTTAAAAMITLQRSGVTFLHRTIPAHDSYTHDFGRPLALATTYTQACDTASAVQAATFGSY